ncbi:MAG: TatD family hydrolase [Clostridia bacterium]|nr:TatD family hydrolase [Clostridia bacterium]
MTYFDTHAHYYDERFSGDECPGGADALLERLFSENVCGIINIATSPDNYDAAIAQARRYPHMYTALGIHPTDTRPLTADPDPWMDGLRARLLDPASRAVALGEIGLDYHYPDTDKERQLAYFHAQMQLARELDVPVVIHDREAHADVLAVVSAYPTVRGVLHSCSCSAEMAREFVRRGYMVSFSGTITFKGARKTVECAASLPPEVLLIETDAPYLAPTPHRGELNHSGLLAHTNAALAACLGKSEEETAALTADNARRFFLTAS